jgi:hypothetical protein
MNQVAVSKGFAVIAYSAVISFLNFLQRIKKGEVKVDVLHIECPHGVSISEIIRARRKALPNTISFYCSLLMD